MCDEMVAVTSLANDIVRNGAKFLSSFERCGSVIADEDLITGGVALFSEATETRFKAIAIYFIDVIDAK